MKRFSLRVKRLVLAAATIAALLSAPPARASSSGGFEASALDAYSMSTDQEIYDSVTYNFLDQYNPTGSWSFFNAGGTDLTVSDPLIIRSAYMKAGVAGSGNDAYPFIEIRGECPSAIAVSLCTLAVNGNAYVFDFSSSALEYAVSQVFKTENNSSVLDLYVPMGNVGIYLLNDLYAARFAFSCSINYNGGSVVTLSHAGYPDGHYSYNWVYQGLLSAGFLDRSGKADPVVQLLTLDAMDNDMNAPMVTKATKAQLPEVPAGPAGGPRDNIYVEPAYPIIFTYYGDSGVSGGVPWFADEVFNISAGRIVTGYTIVYYCADENESQLQPSGGGDVFRFTDIDAVVRPGETKYVPTIQADGFDNVKSVHTAINRIRYDDGTQVIIPDRLWKYCTWIY